MTDNDPRCPVTGAEAVSKFAYNPEDRFDLEERLIGDGTGISLPALSADSVAEMASGKGTKDDWNKVPLSMIPPEAQIEIAKVFAFGAKKYARNNFRNGMAWSRLQDAAERHFKAWQMGEDFDPESGLHHLAHAGCCVMMALVQVLDPNNYAAEFDDRYKGNK